MKFKSDIEVQAGLKDSSGSAGTSGQVLLSTATGVSWSSQGGYVPYTGATGNVNLGNYSLSAYDLIINHASGSGVAASITKGGNGEALTVVKTSGSGNAASITGGVTLISELNLTTSLADAYIASAAIWNAKQNALNGTGFVKISGTTISYDNSTYTPTSRTITINGVTQDLTANRSWTVSGGVSGSGSTGQVAYWNGTNSITGESNLFWDSTNDRLGVGIANPTARLHVEGNAAPGDYAAYINNASGGGNVLKLYNSDWDTTDYMLYATNAGGYSFVVDGNCRVGVGTVTPARPLTIRSAHANATATTFTGALLIHDEQNGVSPHLGLGVAYNSGSQHSWIQSNNTDGTYALALNPAGGNVMIGTTTDAGYKLDVNGTGRFSGTLRISNTTPTQEFFSTGNGDVWGSIYSQASGTGTGASLIFSTKRDGNTATDKMIITQNGVVRVNNLAGSGIRLVTADASGNLSTTTDGAITTYNSTLTLTTSWQNTGIDSSVITTSGVYLVSCFANDFGAGGGQYSSTYVGTMYFYAGGTNGVNANEIPLHHSSHADQGRYIYLRTLSSLGAGDGKLYLQIKGNGTNTSNSTYVFTFKKLL